jgi:DNA-binding transcriptional LysR family regulator
MNIRQIEAFRVVMLRGTMTAAAAELNTSQPSISRLIAELETSIQLRLFDRHAGRLTPTEDGQAFYREVGQAYIGLESLGQAARDIRHFGTGRMRIGTMPALALGFLSKVVRQFTEEFPKVSISLQMRSEATVTRWVSGHYCDIGFIANPQTAQDIEVRPLYRLAAVCAIPNGHRLAKKRLIVPHDLEGEPFVSLAVGDLARPRTDAIFDQAGVHRKLSVESRYGSTICAMVEQGLGIGLVNPIVAHDFRRMNIVFRPFEPRLDFFGNILVSKRSPMTVLMNRFVELAMKQVVTYE